MKMIKDKIEFKRENLENWISNTKYWLNSPLRHVEDTGKYFKEKLNKILSNNLTVVDMGCGNGWLLEFILEINPKVNYIGFDFNKEFIDYLNNKYKKYPNVEFVLADLEEKILNKYSNCADIVFNCFNFFEMANLDSSFFNAIEMLKVNGKLVILTIDYTYLIMAISYTMEEFKDNLRQYEELKLLNEVPYFFQNIDLGDAESKELKYASVFYSFGDFYQQAIKYKLKLSDYGEVIKTSKYLPKTYQYIVFEK